MYDSFSNQSVSVVGGTPSTVPRLAGHELIIGECPRSRNR